MAIILPLRPTFLYFFSIPQKSENDIIIARIHFEMPILKFCWTVPNCCKIKSLEKFLKIQKHGEQRPPIVPRGTLADRTRESDFDYFRKLIKLISEINSIN